MTNDKEPVLDNRADLVDPKTPGQQKFPDCCDDTLVFGMRDQHHEFGLGLTAVLACPHYAEQEGEVPALDHDWWTQLYNRYPSLQQLTAERGAFG